MASGSVYAIDFGTSNSILGFAGGASASARFIPLDPQAREPTILRSLLYFPSASQVFFGQEAVREFAARDQVGRFIRSIKRQLPSRTFVGTFVDNRPFNLEDLIAVFLGEMRRRANAAVGEDVTRVVLGRPARFAPDEADDRFAQGRLEQAARLAGFKEILFFPEPVAAAFGYSGGAGTGAESRGELILAADYGGGTSDFTVYRMSGTTFRPEDVLSMGGVSLAGDALDASLMRERVSLHFGTGVQYRVPFGSNVLTMPRNLMERICHPAEISLLRRQDTYEFLKNVKQWSLGDEDQAKMERLFTLLNDQLGFPLFEKIEGTKRGLSDAPQATFAFDYPGIEIEEQVTRREFEDYAQDALGKIDAALEETLVGAGIPAAQISRVLCTGGTGRVAWIRKSLERRFGAEKILDLDPFTGVASGLLSRAREVQQSS